MARARTSTRCGGWVSFLRSEQFLSYVKNFVFDYQQQAFARLSAVYGGVYMLHQAVDKVTLLKLTAHPYL